MIRKISKDEQLLINTISANLPPANEYIAKQITLARDIAKKYLEDKTRIYDKEDNIYLHSLRVAAEVAEFAKNTSDSPLSFKYDLVIIALLHDVIEDADSPELREELNAFRTLGGNRIVDGIISLSNDEEKIKEVGRSKYISMKFGELKKDNDLFTVKLIDRLDNLVCLSLLKMSDREQELFVNNYLLESLIVYNNLCMSNFYPNNNSVRYYQEFSNLLISEYKF